VLSVLTVVFQGVALTGSLIITEAVFTYILSGLGLFLSVPLFYEVKSLGIQLGLFSVTAIVFQSIVLAMLL
jgi:hypothetical protein